MDNELACAAGPSGCSANLVLLHDKIYSATGVEMAFVGSDPYGIFSGGLILATNTIAWGSTG